MAKDENGNEKSESNLPRPKKKLTLSQETISRLTELSATKAEDWPPFTQPMSASYNCDSCPDS